MLFPTATFVIFFLAVLPLSWLLMRHGRSWRVFMIAASFVFYAWWDWRFIGLLAVSIVWNQLLAVGIAREGRPERRKALLALAVVGDLSMLAYFKYYDFFVVSSSNLGSYAGFDIPLATREIVLPVGISFFTFMAISYVVDVYRRDTEPTSFSRFAVYLSFFPHLVAGPIVRAGELVPQLATPRDPRRVDASRAFYLIAAGLFKKLVIASFLARTIVDPVFAAPSEHSSLEILVAIYAYAVQIYADFSGYTDMAIGIALLLGFRFPQNFNSPYAATSLQDFWHRWHMTLSRWLRDYLYIPLGGSRRGRLLTYRNLMITMLLGGLWHGAAWTFVIWGGLHGAGLAFERWRRERSPERSTAPSTARLWRNRLITFNFVCLAWVFFRASSLDSAEAMLRGLVGRWGEPSPLVTFGVIAAIAVGIGAQYLPSRLPSLAMARFSRLPLAGQAVVLGACVMLVSTLGPTGVPPFIYFQF